jgi:hypothetical protein
MYGLLGRFLRIADEASDNAPVSHDCIRQRLAEIRDEYDELIARESVSA